MKHHYTIWVILIGLCLAGLYPYRNELNLYWREWSSFQRHFTYENDGQIRLRRPFLSKSVSKQDPEAAMIAEWIIHESNDNFEDIEYLSEQAIQFPTNQYFLYDLASRLASRTYVDPQIINKIADRLIELDPNNGRYYFLKAWAVFYDWGDNRVEKTLGYLEKSFSSPYFKDPYDLYKERTCRLMENERPTVFLSHRPLFWRCIDREQLIQDIFVYTQDLIINSQSDKAIQIHDQLQQIAERSIPQKRETPWGYSGLTFTPSYYMRMETPQTVELKWMDLSPQRAKQDRLQMLAWNRWQEQLSSLETAPTNPPPLQVSLSIKEKTPLAAHGFQVTIASIVVLLLFFIIGFILKMQQSRLPWFIFAAMMLVSFGYFLVCRFSDYQRMHHPICGDHHYTFDYVPYSFWIFEKLGQCKPLGGYIFFGVCLILGIIAIMMHKKLFPYNLFFRLIINILCILFIGVLWIKITRLQFVTLIVDIAFLAIVISLLCYRRGYGHTNGYYGLFSESHEGMQYRGRCVLLSGYAMVLHLIVCTCFVPSLAAFTSCTVQEEKGKTIFQTVDLPRFTVDPNDYLNMLSMFETENGERIELNQWLPMVEPTDIPKYLTKLIQLRKSDPNGYWGGMMGYTFPGTHPFDMPTTMTFVPDRDYLSDLQSATTYCSKDTLPYILPFFKDPNSTSILILRACFKDTAVKECLIELWRQNINSLKSVDEYAGRDILNDQRSLLEALVQVCPFSESKQYIIEYCSSLVKYPRHDWIGKEIMEHLDRQQKQEIVNFIKRVMEKQPNSVGDGFDFLVYNCDLEVTAKEWLWKQLIQRGNAQDERDNLDDIDLRYKPSDYHISGPLLAECLDNKNERLRAMGQHIWRKLGKPYDEQVLQGWVKDTNFVIRANVALFRSDMTPANDPSALVQLMRNLAQKNTGSSN